MASSEPGMPGQLRIGEQVRGKVVAVLSGDLDLTNADLIGDQLRGVVRRRGPRVLALDLGAVDFCDCAALRALVGLHREGSSAGTRVVISVASPAMVWLLRLFVLERRFGYPTAGPTAGGSSG